MSQPTGIETSRDVPAYALYAVAAGAILMVSGALALWMYYGPAVFYEMILAGIAACF